MKRVFFAVIIRAVERCIGLILCKGWGTENSESEIIAFHLDKLLAFHRVLPVVGKRLRLSELRVPPMSEPTGTLLLLACVVARICEVTELFDHVLCRNIAANHPKVLCRERWLHLG